MLNSFNIRLFTAPIMSSEFWPIIRNVPISSSARQHLVDSDDVEGMEPHADVELVLTAILDEVLVTANTSGFQRLGAQLFVFVGDEMDA